MEWAGVVHLPGEALNGSFSHGLSFVFLPSWGCCTNNSDISPEASVGSAGLSAPGHGVVPGEDGTLRTCWLQPATGFLATASAKSRALLPQVHQWLEELRDEGDESEEGAGVKVLLLLP